MHGIQPLGDGRQACLRGGGDGSCAAFSKEVPAGRGGQCPGVVPEADAVLVPVQQLGAQGGEGTRVALLGFFSLSAPHLPSSLPHHAAPLLERRTPLGLVPSERGALESF